jgi:type I restriction enzyme R subunit
MLAIELAHYPAFFLGYLNQVHTQVQVIKQFEQAGSAANRYDVTILVNGLPLGANRA